VVRARLARRRFIEGRYDAAQTTAENARHWAMADSLSADSAASGEVRRRLRERARYEVANNSYAKGIVLTMANDCVGTGPRLQLLSGDTETNRLVEEAFARWARAVDLAGKLRTMRMAKATDGETFAVLTANPLVDSPVMLDIHLVEADRVASPFGALPISALDVDGVQLDVYGNPQTYNVLRQHPGELGNWLMEADRVPANAVVHWFRADRPGQHRGVPEITPALPLFAQLRRYTLAVLAAAETAADFAAVLYTDSPANGEATPLDPMDVVALEKRMATVLPDGWRLGQVEAQQPATGYGEFKREILNEIARCLNLPYNIAACNSSGYNYASDRTTRKVLSRFGAFVRRAARSSIRKRKRASAPGEPPTSRTGLLRRFIFFGYDRTKRSVVIGPTRLNQRQGDAPHALEYGGMSTVVEALRGKRKKRRVKIEARPYMGPAFEKEEPKLPGMWRNSVR